MFFLDPLVEKKGKPEAMPKFLIVMCICHSCFIKFKCLGDVLDSVIPITVCHIEVPSFGRFYNLAQILI